MLDKFRDSQDIPKWLKPFLRNGAYSPDVQFLMDLVPQSRIEAILKYGFLSRLVTYGRFLVPESTSSGAEYLNFIDADGNLFHVPA